MLRETVEKDQATATGRIVALDRARTFGTLLVILTARGNSFENCSIVTGSSPASATIDEPENIATLQYDNLRNRNVALVLGRFPSTMNEPDLVAEPMFDEPNVVAACADSPWAKRRNLTLAELIGEPWVLAQPGSLARSLQDEVFRSSGLEPPFATVQTVSLHLYMRLVETGRWLGLVPGSAMRFGGKHMRLKVLPVKTLSPPAPVGVVTVRDRTLTPLAERLIECARKVANSDVGRASSRRP